MQRYLKIPEQPHRQHNCRALQAPLHAVLHPSSRRSTAQTGIVTWKPGNRNSCNWHLKADYRDTITRCFCLYLYTNTRNKCLYSTTMIQSAVLTSDLLLVLYIYFYGPLNHFCMLQWNGSWEETGLKLRYNTSFPGLCNLLKHEFKTFPVPMVDYYCCTYSEKQNST